MENSLMNPVFLVSGRVQEGKSTLVQGALRRLPDSLRTGGFLSLPNMEAGGRKGLYLKGLAGERFQALATMEDFPGAVAQGRYFFHPEAFQAGFRWVEEDLRHGCALVVVDEVGPLELRGMGWAPLLDKLVQSPPMPMLWIVREDSLLEVVRRWNLRVELIHRLQGEGDLVLSKKMNAYVNTYEGP